MKGEASENAEAQCVRVKTQWTPIALASVSNSPLISSRLALYVCLLGVAWGMNLSSNSDSQTMNPMGTSQPTERLPLELLEKMLTYMSVPDILRMKQVGRSSDCA